MRCSLGFRGLGFRGSGFRVRTCSGYLGPLMKLGLGPMIRDVGISTCYHGGSNARKNRKLHSNGDYYIANNGD